MQDVRPLTVLLLAFSADAGALAAATPDSAFMQANASVMDRMMAGMATRPSGSVDTDFVNMMEPHHRGAIEMAMLEIRYGHDERLRRIAQEIIIDQQQEIAAMRLAIGRPLPSSAPAPTQEAGPSYVAAPAPDPDGRPAAATQKGARR